MQPYQTKTLALRECRRCKTTWSDERAMIEIGDHIDIIKVKIAYCPACAEGYGAKSERPTYERRAIRRPRS